MSKKVQEIILPIWLIVIVILIGGCFLYKDKEIYIFNTRSEPRKANTEINGYNLTSWEIGETTAFQYEQVGKDGNNTAYKISVEEQADVGIGFEVSGLENNEFYKISAYIKTIDVESNEGKYGAGITEYGEWISSHQLVGDNDWTLTEIIIKSDDEGKMKFIFRLGFWYAEAKGTVYFDEMNIEKVENGNGSEKIITSDDGKVRIVVNLNDYQASGIKEECARQWANRLSMAKDKYYELTSYEPFNGKVDIIGTNYYPSAWAFAGDPIQLMQAGVVEHLKEIEERGDDWSFGILHEMGHNYDRSSWLFDSEMWANTEMAYILEELNGTVYQNNIAYAGKDIKNYYKLNYDKNGLQFGDGVTYKLLDIKDTLTEKTGKSGWEIYKKVFKYFGQLSTDEEPKNELEKFVLFLDKMSEYSNVEIIKEFSQNDWNTILAKYGGIPVNNIEINENSLKMKKGETSQLTANITPNNATYNSCIWTSSDTSVVTVDQNGNLYAVEGGEATITVTPNDGMKTAICTVVVEKTVESVNLNKSEITMHEGEKDSTLQVIINPTDATNQNITWKTSNSNIVEVNQNTGELIAKGEGTAAITVEVEESGKTSTCKVTVINPKLNLPLDEENAKWNNVNKNIELINTIEGKQYEYLINEENVWKTCEYNDTYKKWEINITSDGIHKIKIRLKDSSVVSEQYVYKLDTIAPKLSVIPNQMLEEKQQITIQINVSDIASGVKNTNIGYAFSLETTAPVSEEEYQKTNLVNGKTTLITPNNVSGEYYLYIKNIEDNAMNTSCTDTHRYGPYKLKPSINGIGVMLNETNKTLKVGEKTSLQAIYTPGDANILEMNWSSKDENVVKVENGVVTAISEGITTVTILVIDENGNNASTSCAITVEKNEEDAENLDSTISKEEIPYSGIKERIITILIALIVLVVSFKRYINLKDIK